MELQFAACEGDPFHFAIWGPNTPDFRYSVGQQLLTKWRNDPFLQVIKCVAGAAFNGAPSADAGSPICTIMAFCLWEVFERERSMEEWMA
jgi:hypothetical protein